jgi:hypothetical protein
MHSINKLALLGLAVGSLIGCGSGIVDDGRSVCSLAAQHVQTCKGAAAPVESPSCDGQAAAEANTILGMGCDTVQSMSLGGGRSTTSESPCTAEEQDYCQSFCTELFEASSLRLKKATCELLQPGDELPDGTVVESATVHCQCKGYWWPF